MDCRVLVAYLLLLLGASLACFPFRKTIDFRTVEPARKAIDVRKVEPARKAINSEKVDETQLMLLVESLMMKEEMGEDTSDLIAELNRLLEPLQGDIQSQGGTRPQGDRSPRGSREQTAIHKTKGSRKAIDARSVKVAHKAIDAREKTAIRKVEPARKAIDIRKVKDPRKATDVLKATDVAQELQGILALVRAQEAKPDKRENVRYLTADTQDGGQQNGGQNEKPNRSHGDATLSPVRNLTKGEVLKAVRHRISELFSASGVATKQAPIHVLAGFIQYLAFTELTAPEVSYIYKLFAEYEASLPAPPGSDREGTKRAIARVAIKEIRPLMNAVQQLQGDGVTPAIGHKLFLELARFVPNEFSDLQPLEVMLRKVTEITEGFMQALPVDGAAVSTVGEVQAIVDKLRPFLRQQIHSLRSLPITASYKANLLRDFLPYVLDLIPEYRKSLADFLSELEVMLDGGATSLSDTTVDYLGEFITSRAFGDVQGPLESYTVTRALESA